MKAGGKVHSLTSFPNFLGDTWVSLQLSEEMVHLGVRHTWFKSHLFLFLAGAPFFSLLNTLSGGPFVAVPGLSSFGAQAPECGLSSRGTWA